MNLKSRSGARIQVDVEQVRSAPWEELVLFAALRQGLDDAKLGRPSDQLTDSVLHDDYTAEADDAAVSIRPTAERLDPGLIAVALFGEAFVEEGLAAACFGFCLAHAAQPWLPFTQPEPGQAGLIEQINASLSLQDLRRMFEALARWHDAFAAAQMALLDIEVPPVPTEWLDTTALRGWDSPIAEWLNGVADAPPA